MREAWLWRGTVKFEPLNAPDQDLQQGIVDLVGLGLGPAVVEICGTLDLDGGWIENLALDEMITLHAGLPL